MQALRMTLYASPKSSKRNFLEVAAWLSELPPLSPYYEWSPRPSKGTRRNTLEARHVVQLRCGHRVRQNLHSERGDVDASRLRESPLLLRAQILLKLALIYQSLDGDIDADTSSEDTSSSAIACSLMRPAF